MDDLLIPNVSECKYLGTIICQKNCDLDIKRQMRKFYANVNMLLKRSSKCSTPVKCYLFKTYCSNLYCASLWYNYTMTAMKKLKIAYNNSIRRLFCLPKHNSASEMCVCLNIMSFGELLRKYIYMYRFRLRLSSSLNSVIDNIYMSIVALYSNIWAWWHTILTVYFIIDYLTNCFIYFYIVLDIIRVYFNVNYSLFYMDHESEINNYTYIHTTTMSPATRSKRSRHSSTDNEHFILSPLFEPRLKNRKVLTPPVNDIDPYADVVPHLDNDFFDLT